MSYTITPGFDTDDYIITLADGRVIVVDGLTLNNLHSLDGTIDTEIDVDGLIANATAGNNSLAVFVCFAKGTWITTPSGQVPI